jgi:hypothetical protein
MTFHTTQEGTVAIDVPSAATNTANGNIDSGCPVAPAGAPYSTRACVDDEIMVALSAAAAKEPPESNSRWQVFGFESSIVEDCYEATHGPTRLLGCWVLFGLMIILLGARITRQASSHALAIATDFHEWLAVTCVIGMLVTMIPIMLCSIQGGVNANRHLLWRAAHGTAIVAFIAVFVTNLGLLQGSISNLDTSGQASWAATSTIWYIFGASSVMGPLYMALLLRVSFPWAATAATASAVACVAILTKHSTTHMMPEVLSATCFTIGMLYTTEATSRQRFVAQIHNVRLQADREQVKADHEHEMNTLKAENAARNQDSDNEGKISMPPHPGIHSHCPCAGSLQSRSALRETRHV